MNNDKPVDNLGARRVLCVDDSPTFRAVLHFAFAKYPDVEIVKITESPMETVSEAVHSAHEGKPYEAILLDIQMGPPDGVKVARILRKNSAYKTAPIFFLTATTKVETLREAGELGIVIQKERRSANDLVDEIADHLRRFYGTG